MNVASLELCKELYELSGWDNTEFGWFDVDGDTHWAITHDAGGADVVPAYDCGYLLRQLPNTSLEQTVKLFADGAVYTAIYYRHKNGGYDTNSFHTVKDTPENALCKLAIELFKQNVLVKESK